MNMNQATTFFQDRQSIGIKPGLERMEMLLTLIGNPQDNLTAIHIAGTNGKGSTIAYMNQGLIANGYRVGVFTSPSLQGLTGHILDSGKPIANKDFVALLNEIYPAIKQMDQINEQPTEFEIITAIAFMYFAKNSDIALIETGMGGREDTTNCIVPLLSIITNVSKDHAKFLGNRLEQIAFHKAGIIKEGIPVIVGETNPDLQPIFYQEAEEKQAEVIQMGKDFSYANVVQLTKEQQFLWCSGGTSISVSIKMHGLHQVKNASIAMMVFHKLKKAGVVLEWNKILAGMNNATLPGRFELVHENPVIILDGAHNLAGIEAFLKTVIREYGTQKKRLIFAGFQDKELSAMLEKCLPHFDCITVTSFTHPRAARAGNVAKMSQFNNMEIIERWQEVLDAILVSSKLEHNHIFIAGSLHFIGIVREYIKRNNR